MNFVEGVSRTRGQCPATPPIMYFTILYEQFHDNRMGFISLSKEDIKEQLIRHLRNWDCEFTEEELETILRRGEGYADEMSKSYVAVTITEIQPGEEIDLQ